MHTRGILKDNYGWSARVLLNALAIIVSLIVLPVNSHSQQFNPLSFGNTRFQVIDSIMNYMVEKGDFSGTVFLSSKGKVIYEKAFGYSNRELLIKNTSNTAFDVASTIKPLVAAGVMKLCENGKLSIEDELTSFFKGFPYQRVKIKHLLSHTSGLPEYTHDPRFLSFVTNKKKKDANHIVSNQDLIDWLYSFHKPTFTPGEKYTYCNSNYVLLCSVIEKVSRLSFYDFMRDYILKPAEMNNSKLYDEINNYGVSVRALGYEATLEGKYIPYVSNHLKGMLGDGGLYSTAGDLQKFLIKFLEGSIVSSQSRNNSLTPFKLNSGKNSTYGFGWIIREEGYTGRPLTYKHGGRWEGFLSAFAYEPGNDNSIIILTNNNIYPQTIGELEGALSYALSGKVPVLPRFPIQDTIARTIYGAGIEKAIELFWNIKEKYSSRYFINENDMNYLVLCLILANKKNEAIQILEMNKKAFPESSNNFDSIGDIYLELGNKDRAKEAYRKALMIDPNNQGAKNSLNDLEK